jgi:hypothetical protein
MGERTNVTAYMRWFKDKRGIGHSGYDALWRWSVKDLAEPSTDIVLDMQTANDITTRPQHQECADKGKPMALAAVCEPRPGRIRHRSRSVT